jgi:hypothetical protein
MEGLPIDPLETSGDCSDRRLHCEDGPEPGPAFRHAVAHLPRRDVGSHGNDLAHWLVA